MAAGRDEINRINVFPVPDGDTGTNFSLTLRSVADALRALGDAPLDNTARTAARGAVLGARGNSGMMLAHFLLGFAEALEGRADRRPRRTSPRAIRQGADRLYSSLDDPREGTILTVAREAALAAERAAADSPDISVFMSRLLAEGEVALARTPELMAVLKEAGVVDAGGKGFVRMIEGVVRLIEGDPILPATATTGEFSSIPAAEVDVAAERDFQFCTEVMVRGEQLPVGQRGTLRPARVRRQRAGRGGGRHPQDSCAHRYAGGRLYLCSPLGNGLGDQGGRHAGAASAACASRAAPGRDRGRQLRRSCPMPCWTGIISRWCRCR